MSHIGEPRNTAYKQVLEQGIEITDPFLTVGF